MTETRTIAERTYGQKLVRVDHNPSGDSEVDKIKQTFADAIDMVDAIPVERLQNDNERQMGKSAKAEAIRSLLNASMLAVYAATASK